MLDPGNLQGGGGGVVKARLDLCDLKGGLTVVSGAGPASCLHLGQEALHRIPMAELVLNWCIFVESSCHGQGHLNLLARLGTEVAIAVHALDSVSSVSLVALALPVLSKLSHVGLLLASGVGITVADVLAIPLLGRAVLLVCPCLAAASLLRVWSGDRVLLALPAVLVAPRAVRVGGQRSTGSPSQRGCTCSCTPQGSPCLTSCSRTCASGTRTAWRRRPSCSKRSRSS